MKKVTIRDIAAYTGISAATVNRALRDNGYVSDEKRKIILEAAEKLGYFTSNAVAKITSPMDLIVYFSLSNSHPLFAHLSEEIARSALQANYYVIHIYVDRQTTTNDIVQKIDALLAHGVKGIIFNALADHLDLLSIEDYLQSLTIPLVMIERTAEIYNINKVRINTAEAMFLAVRHLWEHNHKEIKLFNPNRYTSVENNRIDGFFNAVNLYGIKTGAEFIPTRWYQPEDGYQAIEQYLADHPLPKAIVAADSVLIGILQYFYTHGIRVPEDVSLLGFDNTYSGFSSPPITTIAFPVKQMCDLAISMIHKQNMPLNEHHSAQEILLSPYLIERSSVRKI